MRIQILSINFEPEQTGTAPYISALARHLSRAHDVTVVTGLPHYPDWRVAPEWQHWRTVEREDRLSVIRLCHYVPRKQDSVRRAAYELTWASRALVEGLRHPADVVLAVVPALLTPQIGARIASRHRAAFGVIVQDIMSRAAAQSGIRGGKTAANAAAKIERSGLHKADGICTIHSRFAQVLSTEFAVAPSIIRVIYNWSHIEPPTRDRAEMRRRLGWPEDEIVALHSGNMGLKQELDNLVNTARLAQERCAPLRFVLAGDGNQRSRLAASGAGLANLEIRDGVASAEFPDFLAAADVLLVNERLGVLEMSLPSKLTSYFASGRPVLAATEATSATAELLNASGAGIVTAPADPHALLDAILDLGSDLGRAEALGKSGRQFAFDELDGDSALAAYQNWVEQLVRS